MFTKERGHLTLSFILEAGMMEKEILSVGDGFLARGRVGGGAIKITAGVSGLIVGVRR